MRFLTACHCSGAPPRDRHAPPLRRRATLPASIVPIIMSLHDPATTAHRLAELRLEHRDLDVAIERLARLPGTDEMHIRRLKKRKLRLKDMIARLESELIPDLDA